MKRLILILCLLTVIFGCTIYKSKFFEPVNRDDNKGYATIFWIGQFENWDTKIIFSAYYLSRKYPRDNYFHIWINASTYDQETYVYKDTNYKADIKTLKVLYGNKFQNELLIGKTELTVDENAKSVSISNEDDFYVSPDIKMVKVIIEMEFTDTENNTIPKKYIVLMKRKKDSSIGFVMD